MDDMIWYDLIWYNIIWYQFTVRCNETIWSLSQPCECNQNCHNDKDQIVSLHRIVNWYHLISYQIISEHIISYHVISNHIIPYHTYHILSYPVKLYHIILQCIISYHTMLYQCNFMSYPTLAHANTHLIFCCTDN